MKITRKGFSLVELLVVIGLILLLAAILFPVFGHVREQGRKSLCASNLKQIGLAFLQYSQDHADKFPLKSELPVKHELLSVQPYLRSTQILVCPSDIGNGGQDTTPYYKMGNGSSYDFNSGASELLMSDSTSYCFLPRHSTPPVGLNGINVSQIKSTSRVVLVSEKSATSPFSWHDGPVDGNSHQNARSNICFVDGHVKFIRMYLDDAGLPPFTYDDSICYEPPGTSSQTSTYEYQWGATP